MKQVKILTGLFTLSALVLLVGCFPLSTMHTARPIPKGETEFSIIPNGWGVYDREEKKATTIADLELQFRHGINDRIDFGIRVLIPGILIDFNLLIVDINWFCLSVDPAATVMMMVFSEPFGSVWLPVLMDFNPSRSFTITLGPKIGYFLGSRDRPMGMVGATLGSKFPLSPTTRIMLELAGAAHDTKSALYTAAVGFGFML